MDYVHALVAASLCTNKNNNNKPPDERVYSQNRAHHQDTTTREPFNKIKTYRHKCASSSFIDLKKKHIHLKIKQGKWNH